MSVLSIDERIGDREASFRRMMEGMQSGIYTSCIATVTSFDGAAITVEAQPTIQARVQAPDGTVSDQNLPLLVDVPVCFPGGGGYTLTFPIAPGDEVLVVFSQRAIDGWFQNGGPQRQTSFRMHDLSDGIAIPCLRNLQRPLAGGVNGAAVELRSDDGATSIAMGAGGAVTVNCVTYTVNATTIQLNSPTLRHNTKNVGATHTHPVTSAPGNTGVPN